MTLNDFQQQVNEYVSSAWSDTESVECLIMYLTEEMGELARSIRKLGVKRWGHDEDSVGTADDVAGELGDMLFLMARIAKRAGVQLDDAGVAVLDKLAMRLVAAADENS